MRPSNKDKTNIMKKLLCLIMVLAMITAAISLASCGDVSDEESTSDSTSGSTSGSDFGSILGNLLGSSSDSGTDSPVESVFETNADTDGETTSESLSDSPSDLLNSFTQAMWTDNYSISLAGVEYFYKNVVNSYIQMLEAYGMLSYISFDSTKSHKDQECSLASDGSSWFDFFLSSTKSEVKKLLACAEAAHAEGITLDEEDYDTIDEAIESLKDNAKSYGYTLKEYLSAVYGPSVTESVVRECLEFQSIYDKYITAHVDAADISDATLEKIYEENREDYDVVEYLTFTFDYRDFYLDGEEQSSSEAYSTTDRDEAVKKSQLDAGALKADLDSADTLEDKIKVFEDFLKDYLTDEFGLTDEQYQNNKGNFKLTVSYRWGDDVLEWAFDDSTAAGDAKLFTEKEEHEHTEGDDESKLADVYTVVLLTETAHRDESLATADVRHILFSDTDYEDDTKVQETLAELRKFVGTDEFIAKFEEYAKEYSFDTSNKDNGGLMEDLTKGSTVTEFDEWVFGGEHKEGDLGIVKTADYGWHIVYIDKEGLPVWKKTLVDEIQANAMYEAESIAADTYTVEIDDTAMSEGIDA